MSKNTGTAGRLPNETGTAAEGAGTLVAKARVFAEKEFGRLGGRGEQILKHGERTAESLASQGFDDTTVIAAILHDIIADAGTPPEKIAGKFGEEAMNIIEEHAKIIEIEERNAGKISPQLLSQVILATAKDIRAIFLTVAAKLDRLQNPFDTPKERLAAIAQIVMDVYAPVCHKLGLYELKAELEDACFRVIQLDAYEKVARLAGKTREEMKELVRQAVKELEFLLKKEGIKATVQGRAKNFFTINKKMAEQDRPFSDIFDLLGARIICDTIKECYEALGVVHAKYKIVPARFTDYIANPKENNYRSIHTAVEWNGGMPLEVQIRTWEMHYECETGLAAHWLYKNYAEDRIFDKKLSWAKQIVQWQRTAPDGKDFMQSLRLDFGQNKIFTFTPKQDVIILPEKSTPVDFAFAVHSELGHKCKQAKVNGKIVPLDTKLQNTDVVEIITSKKPETKRLWLSFVRSSKAMVKIRQKLGIVFSRASAEKTPGAQLTTSDKKIRIASCCNPLPGEEIAGVRTTKRKISVHRADCRNVVCVEKEKRVAVAWDSIGTAYNAEIKVTAKDSPGLLPSILKTMSESGVTINSTNAKVSPNNIVTCFFKIRVGNAKQFDTLLGKIRAQPGVFGAQRV
ncbi:MAG: HD domain-containing protein [Candidatus Diapherotrites archaeon]|nr:HD domain-containing protein [Candidatus Diapherotrites archaeon]